MEEDQNMNSSRNQNMNINRSLPIYSYKDFILKTIDEERVVIISGKTGCGKSTQVPQYILNSNPKSKIAVCQPRRIAATSLAIRVSQQNNSELGKQIGYHIGMDIKYSQKTRLTFMTYGILIQKLLYNQNIPYTHIILDEIHERSLQMDFTCIALKKILQENKTHDIKLIIMSATLNAKDFSTYFAINKRTHQFIKPQLTFQQQQMPNKRNQRGSGRRNQKVVLNSTVKRQFLNQQEFINAKCIQLQVNTPFKIEQFFLQDFTKNNGVYHIDTDTRVDEKCFDHALNLILKHRKQQKNGDILVFVPGLYQIKRMKTLIQQSLPQQSIRIIQVHSIYSQDLISKLFNSNNPNKIILATNMGQSSITLPQCTVVIDFCLTRKNYSNKLTGFSRFQTRLASKSSLFQRAGRVGRVSDGSVYRLITRQNYKQLSEFDIPQIKCVSLEMIILKAKQIDSTHKSNLFEDPYDLLLNILEPPELKQIQYAIQSLLIQDALIYHKPEIQSKGTKYSGKNLQMTKIGQFMVSMPCQLRVSKMILFSIKLGISGTIVDIASQFICQKDFFAHQQKRDNIQQFLHAIIGYDQGKCNDYLLRQRIFNHWRQNFYIPYKKSQEQKIEKTKKKEQQRSSQISKKPRYKQKKIQYKEKQKKKYVEKQQIDILKNPLQAQEELYQMNRLVQQFCKIPYGSDQKHWCLTRGIYPTVMRQILRISQNLRNRLKQIKIIIPQQSQITVNNQLVIICLVGAFDQTDCMVQWFSQKNKQIQKGKQSLITFQLNPDWFIYQKDIRNYVKPQQQPEISIKNNFVEIYGSYSVLKKFLIPINLTKSRNNKCSQIFKILCKTQVSYPYQAQIYNKSRKVTILNQSINKVILKRSQNNQFLITNTIQQSKGSTFIKTCALIQEIPYFLISILVKKNVYFLPHPSYQFYQEVQFDNGYRKPLPCFIRNKEINLLLKYRDMIRRSGSSHVSQQSQLIPQQQIKQILNLFKKVQSKSIQQQWQFYFQMQQDKEINHQTKFSLDNKLYSIDQLRNKPFLKQPQTNYFERYKNWKKSYYEKLYHTFKIHTIKQPYFICAVCPLNQITKIQQTCFFDKEKKHVSFNQYRMDHIIKGKDLFCIKNHKIGKIIDEDWVELNPKGVKIYIPFDCIIDFDPNQSEFHEKIDKLFKQKGPQLNQSREKMDYFQCKICLKSNVDESKKVQFSKDQLGNKFWDRVQKHMRSGDHTQRRRKFRE